MAESDRQGGLLANTTAVRTMFLRQYKKFLKLFYHKAYVWQFLEQSGEIEMFLEAQEKVKDLIQDYEDLLVRCVESEKASTPGLSLFGGSGNTGGAGDAGGGGAGAGN